MRHDQVRLGVVRFGLIQLKLVRPDLIMAWSGQVRLGRDWYGSGEVKFDGVRLSD